MSSLGQEVTYAASAIGGAFLAKALFNTPYKWESVLAMGAGALFGGAAAAYVVGNNGLETSLSLGLQNAENSPKTFLAGSVAFTAMIAFTMNTFVLPELQVIQAFVPLFRFDKFGLLYFAIGSLAMLMEFSVVGYPIAVVEWLIDGAQVETDKTSAKPEFEALMNYGGTNRNFAFPLLPLDIMLTIISMPMALFRGIKSAIDGHGFLPVILCPMYGAMAQFNAIGNGVMDVATGLNDPFRMISAHDLDITDLKKGNFAQGFADAWNKWYSVYDPIDHL